MNYLQRWIADRVADKINIISVPHVPKIGLRKKHSAIDDYISMRTKYGAMNHWPLDDNGVDIDTYDHNPDTHYFLAFERETFKKHLNAGMRLTKVYDFDKSLSLSMWGHAVDKPNIVAQLVKNRNDVNMLKRAAQHGNVWDLTRLVTAMSLHTERTTKEKRATYVALLLLLGAAMRFSGEDAVWIFTTNPEMRRFLDRMGIKYTLLAQGRISYSDVGESYFAWADIGQAYDQLKHGQPIIAQLVERGFTKGATPHSGKDSVS